MAVQIIQNDETFSKLWASDLTVDQIAEKYGVRKASVSKAAARFKFPAREKRYRNVGRRPMAPKVEPKEPPKRKPCPCIEGPAFWSKHHDNRVWDTDGRYASINALADEWQVPTAKVLARWHLLRAAA